MAWKLDSDRPIYAQILEIIQMQIISGKYQPGDKIPSVRELAADAGVNPNTMQKALSELERSGLILTQRTSGRTVTDDMELIQKMRDDLYDQCRADWIAARRLFFQLLKPGHGSIASDADCDWSRDVCGQSADP